jgi:hypothetical protein
MSVRKSLKAYKDLEPTYEELAKALKSLNFEDKSNDKAFIFIEKKSGAEVILPMNREIKVVHKAKFASLCWGLEEFGVLHHEHDLGKLIEQYRLQKNEATA